jgi:thioredoxin 1
MTRTVAQALIMSLALLWLTAQAVALPYDESADAGAALSAGIIAAKQQHKKLLVIFGANWCPDCRALDAAMHASVGKFIDTRFVTVKVDVGNFDKNMELSAHYGMPTQKGIPAAVVVDGNGAVLYSTKAGELANARRMSETGLYDFFRKMADGVQ